MEDPNMTPLSFAGDEEIIDELISRRTCIIGMVHINEDGSENPMLYARDHGSDKEIVDLAEDLMLHVVDYDCESGNEYDPEDFDEDELDEFNGYDED